MISQDEIYMQLKGKYRRLILIVGLVAGGWYLLYVMACEFARSFMTYRLFGRVNVALVFGVLEFASTFVIAGRFARFSRDVVDPLAAQVARGDG